MSARVGGQEEADTCGHGASTKKWTSALGSKFKYLNGRSR